MSMEKSLTDLPSNVLVEILVRLPLRTLFVARSVCKTFSLLTTPDPHFINLHSSSAAQILIFQFRGFGFHTPSYLLRLADQELDYENSKLKPLFQLPKMDSVPLTPRFSWQPFSFFLSNSCNGLVYLWQNGDLNDERSLLCNPVTNEYLVIPDGDPKIRLASVTKSMWLGYTPSTDQYKVLRIFRWKDTNHDEISAQVYVIGSDSWTDIDATPLHRPCFYRGTPEALVNGVMYWHDPSWLDLFSFDFELEKSGEVALPAEFQRDHYSSIGVLGGCLCLTCNIYDGHHVHLWVMTKSGSWIKEFVVDITGPCDLHFRPLQFLRNGEILMLLPGYGLICYDPRSKTLKSFKLDRKLDYRVVVLTPSFVPLKDTLKVDNVLSGLRPRYECPDA